MLFKKTFLTKHESTQLSKRIDEFESKTGCELVIHIRKKLGAEPLIEAEKLFHKFNLHKTKHNAAIFVVVSTQDREYAVWVDKNVMLKTKHDVWRKAGGIIEEKLKQNQRLAAFLQLIDFIEPILEKIQPNELKKIEKSLSNELIEEDS
ncbi:MAG: TPM domain-containing protein [Oligoflexia bacterium]|nr:TPM domain-containing protein [Oligoflexia bacterium]